MGDFYTGAIDRLVFINDHDGGSGNTSVFSNVKIYEGSCGNTSATVLNSGNKTPIIGDQHEPGTTIINIAPNPANDSFLLNVTGITDNSITATVFTILGRKASKIKLNAGDNIISARNLSLESGIYLIEVESEGEKLAVHKLIIQ